MLNNNSTFGSLREILDKPDCKAVANTYLNIKAAAFIEYFKALTNRREYYDEVFSTLVELSKEFFVNLSEPELREALTVCNLLFCSEQLLMNNANKSLYIIEKVLIEPLAICGNNKIKIPAADNCKSQDDFELRKEAF